MVLYQACQDPFSYLPTPEDSVMPVRSVILFIMNFANIMCNFYLFQYLEDKRKESTGTYLFLQSWIKRAFIFLAVVDKHKERKRKNLIPARHGIYGIFVFGCHTIASQVAYNALTTKVFNLSTKLW